MSEPYKPSPCPIAGCTCVEDYAAALQEHQEVQRRLRPMLKYLTGIALLLAGCQDCLSSVNTGCRVACSYNSRHPDYNCYKSCITTAMPRCATEVAR